MLRGLCRRRGRGFYSAGIYFLLFFSMFNLNRATVLGHATHDPEVRATKNGKTVASLSIATNRRYKGSDGSYVSEPTYHRLVCWGSLAEAAKHITKGAPVFAEGRIQHSTWKDKDGADKSASEIVVDQLILLSAHGTKAA